MNGSAANTVGGSLGKIADRERKKNIPPDFIPSESGSSSGFFQENKRVMYGLQKP